MQISLEVEGTPNHHRRFIVARLLYGTLKYYSSYTSEKKANTVLERIENGLIIDAREGDKTNG